MGTQVMSRFTHASCERCWIGSTADRDGTGGLAIRVPVRLKEPQAEQCCFCGEPTVFGVYVRRNPTDPAIRCGGQHGEDEEE